MSAIQPLIDLQDLDSQIKELEREEKDIPRRQAQERARMAGADSALASAKEQQAALQARIKQAEDEITACEERVRKMKIQQVSLKTNKEFEAYTMQITGLEQEITALEARKRAAEDEEPSILGRVKAAQEKADADRGGVDAFCTELAERLQAVKEELANLRSQRASLAAAVPRNFLAYYERLRVKRWPAAVQLNRECVCEGCHLVQPPSVEQMVQRGTGLVACTMCGRILYRPQEF